MYTLVIGNKNYSSWSLRGWLLLRQFNINFEEVRLPLYSETFSEKIKEYSPSGLVPILVTGDQSIWDSLAKVFVLFAGALHAPVGNGWTGVPRFPLTPVVK